MLLSTVASVLFVALCEASGNFTSPPGYVSTLDVANNEVWQIDSTQTIAFSATYDEWAVALYQEVDGTGNFIADITGGDNTSPNASFAWTVSTLNASLADSPMFQLRVNNVEEADVFTSTFFNITGGYITSVLPAASTSSGPTVPSLTIGLGVGLGLGIPLLLWGIGLLAWYFLVTKKRAQQGSVEAETQTPAGKQVLREKPSDSDVSVAGTHPSARGGQGEGKETTADVERAIATDSWW